MIRLSDPQAGQLADLFDRLNEVFSLMNAFIDDASGGKKINPDRVAQLRSGTAGVMETAAQVADMLAERSKRKSDRPWASSGAAKFGGLGAPAAGGASRRARGAGKKVPAK